MTTVECKGCAPQIFQAFERRPVSHDDERPMRSRAAAGRAVAGRAEQTVLATEDRLEGITASLRKDHFGADRLWNRRPVECKAGRQINRLSALAYDGFPEISVRFRHFG